jgi:hypothetical protein
MTTATETRIVAITTDAETIIRPGTNGRTKIHVTIPDLNKRLPVPLWLSNEDAAKMEPGGTYLAKLSRGDKYWDWVSFGDPQEAAAEVTPTPAPQKAPTARTDAPTAPYRADPTRDSIERQKSADIAGRGADETIRAYTFTDGVSAMDAWETAFGRFFPIVRDAIQGTEPQPEPSAEAQEWTGDMPDEDQRPDTEE